MPTKSSSPTGRARNKKAFCAYLLQCADGTLYAGSTDDFERRLRAHNGSKAGAKYTRSRRPVFLFYKETFATMQKAKKREAAYKRMTRAEKLALAPVIR